MAFSATDLVSMIDNGIPSNTPLSRKRLNKASEDLFIAYENPLSYGNILDMRESFRKTATWRDENEFNLFDIPSRKYFKILFYFDDTSEDGTGHQGGLLAPTWDIDTNISNLYYHNSAWSYLKINGEDERADNLKQFISLLSNINAHSPWYFQSITGLDAALERKQTMDQNFTIDSECKMLSIKCLADSFDNRIGTLMDLYRSVVWSWATKREMVPSNLRKFDMAIYLYEAPVHGLHNYVTKHVNGSSTSDYATIDKSTHGYVTSYKYIEFHNCEFDYNSAKSGYETIDNAEGITQEYTINIYYDDCYENRYNEFISKEIGDMIYLDTMKYIVDSHGEYIGELEKLSDISPFKKSSSELAGFKNQTMTNVADLDDRINALRYTENESPLSSISQKLTKKLVDKIENTVKTAATEVVGWGVNKVKSKLKNVLLGNINSFSLTRVADNIGGLLNGQVVSTISKTYQKDNGNNSLDIGKLDYPLGNIFNKKNINDQRRQAESNTLANTL